MGYQVLDTTLKVQIRKRFLFIPYRRWSSRRVVLDPRERYFVVFQAATVWLPEKKHVCTLLHTFTVPLHLLRQCVWVQGDRAERPYLSAYSLKMLHGAAEAPTETLREKGQFSVRVRETDVQLRALDPHQMNQWITAVNRACKTVISPA